MHAQLAVRLLLTALLAGLLAAPDSAALARPEPPPADDGKPPPYRGGVWLDEFGTEQFSDAEGVELRGGRLLLRLTEALRWTQTWTAHFAGGEFWHTEAISDSVRLAPAGDGQFYPTGVYTATVLDAGKTVDWSWAEWRHSGAPERLAIEFRTGDSPAPDGGWTAWAAPQQGFEEYLCVVAVDPGGGDPGPTECESGLSGVESSRYLQYRARFASDDPARTVALYDFDLLYGLRVPAGSAASPLVAPGDLGAWQGVVISATVPPGTALTVDVLSADGEVLLADVAGGDSLAGIDPQLYPALKLRARLTTGDRARSPDLDRWGLRWAVQTRTYLPLVLRSRR